MKNNLLKKLKDIYAKDPNDIIRYPVVFCWIVSYEIGKMTGTINGHNFSDAKEALDEFIKSCHNSSCNKYNFASDGYFDNMVILISDNLEII